MEIISDYDKIMNRLKAEGRVSEIVLTPEQIQHWSEEMNKIREESRIKQNQSWMAAKDVWLD